ncbi:hypothetical protein [Kineococcus radiotolerans]|uniref:Uncharacterized protein n=1 Tax=Kineococcus radiotolerans (strain ATCC BAA-149 / DSM 14245 / SRS30216) TaxID=266940 RepID=A6WA81_KINRD|nr:hypothetical protein [Kineococcus radiotolerans]ABS03720.1 hypothetical protein Krad_2239 [Kineococcus radiotolerans SRS30216 = ATCC BAA-149]
MTQTPTHQPASADTSASTRAGTNAHASASVTALSSAAPDGEDPATRAARARHTNAHRAAYAAQALHHHTRASGSHAEDMQQALIELLSDLHHLCHTCDLDLAPLYQAATLVYDREAHAA